MATTATTATATKKPRARSSKPKPRARRPRPKIDPILVDALRRQVEIAEAAAATVEANRDPVGLLAAGVIRLCAAAYPNAIGAKLLIETRDDDRFAEILLPVEKKLLAVAGKVAAEKPARDVEESYRRMVAAVRQWLALEHPRAMPDRVDVCLYSDDGGGESVAWFHASATDPYALGDRRAIGPAD